MERLIYNIHKMSGTILFRVFHNFSDYMCRMILLSDDTEEQEKYHKGMRNLINIISNMNAKTQKKLFNLMKNKQNDIDINEYNDFIHEIAKTHIFNYFTSTYNKHYTDIKLRVA